VQQPADEQPAREHPDGHAQAGARVSQPRKRIVPLRVFCSTKAAMRTTTTEHAMIAGQWDGVV
jgi:hypothetical protein